MTRSEVVWLRLVERVEARDASGAAACFTERGVWQNVPHPPSVGRAAIEDLLGPILRRSTTVRWDTVTASFADERAWLERVDRFWIGGVEYAVRCHGVLELDPAGDSISALRDYVDLGEWRQRLAAAGPLD
mgnify:CR=1 FL=1